MHRERRVLEDEAARRRGAALVEGVERRGCLWRRRGTSKSPKATIVIGARAAPRVGAPSIGTTSTLSTAAVLVGRVAAVSLAARRVVLAVLAFAGSLGFVRKVVGPCRRERGVDVSRGRVPLATSDRAAARAAHRRRRERPRRAARRSRGRPLTKKVGVPAHAAKPIRELLRRPSRVSCVPILRRSAPGRARTRGAAHSTSPSSPERSAPF